MLRVRELIERLQKCPNQDARVAVLSDLKATDWPGYEHPEIRVLEDYAVGVMPHVCGGECEVLIWTERAAPNVHVSGEYK